MGAIYVQTLTRPLTRLAQAGLDLLFPPRCAACGHYGDFLCQQCSDDLPRALPPRCTLCWQPTTSGGTCRRCQQEPLSLKAIRSTFVYQGAVRTIVHAFKYGHVFSLAKSMAALMSDTLQRELPTTAVIVPVPLSQRREQSRGYNQARLLARELANINGWPLVEKALVRRRNTPPQARQAMDARRLNMQDAFRAQPNIIPTATSVVLIDDVVTTGATMDACSHALKEIGVKEVYGLAFARED